MCQDFARFACKSFPKLTGFKTHAQTTFEMVQNGNSKGKLLGGTAGSFPVSLYQKLSHKKSWKPAMKQQKFVVLNSTW